MAFAVSAILIVIGVVVIAELFDSREARRQQQIMREGIKVRGTVKTLEHKGFGDARSAYNWRITVEFEYEGHIYLLEQPSVGKPVLCEGDYITVYVSQKDPWKSRFIVNSRIPA